MLFSFDTAFFQKLDAFLGVLAVKRPSQPHPKPLTYRFSRSVFLPHLVLHSFEGETILDQSVRTNNTVGRSNGTRDLTHNTCLTMKEHIAPGVRA